MQRPGLRLNLKGGIFDKIHYDKTEIVLTALVGKE